MGMRQVATKSYIKQIVLDLIAPQGGSSINSNTPYDEIFDNFYSLTVQELLEGLGMWSMAATSAVLNPIVITNNTPPIAKSSYNGESITYQLPNDFIMPISVNTYIAPISDSNNIIPQSYPVGNRLTYDINMPYLHVFDVGILHNCESGQIIKAAVQIFYISACVEEKFTAQFTWAVIYNLASKMMSAIHKSANGAAQLAQEAERYLGLARQSAARQTNTDRLTTTKRQFSRLNRQ